MVAVKEFTGLLDDFWKAGAGDSFTLVASGDKSAYKRMVKACADAYPYVIVRGALCRIKRSSSMRHTALMAASRRRQRRVDGCVASMASRRVDGVASMASR